jgi:N-acetylmuramoyl-L-alanine amidase
MYRAANPLAALGVFLLQLFPCAWATAQVGASSGNRSPTVSASPVAVDVPAGSGRAAPSRPTGVAEASGGKDRPAIGAKALAPLPVTRIKGTDYVAASDVATRLSFKKSWEESKRELTLSAGPRRLVLTAEKREVSCNGLRVFLGEAVLFRSGQLYVTKTDYERCLLSLLRPDLVGEPVPRLRTIVLDPGHGGADPGMQNKSLGIQEKVLVLDVALRLEKLLKTEGYSVVLTRRDERGRFTAPCNHRKCGRSRLVCQHPPQFAVP